MLPSHDVVAALDVSKLQLTFCSYSSVIFCIAAIIPELSMDAFGLLFIEPELHRDVPAIAQVYVKLRDKFRAPANGDAHVLTVGSRNWHHFERELDRLQRELDDIRREAQLRFADSEAKRYRRDSQALRVLRGRR